jgi:hypothetical protein
VFIPSSDEEDIQKRRRVSKKQNDKTAKGKGKASHTMSADEIEGLVGRILSFIPSPKIHGLKLPKIEPFVSLKEYDESHFNGKTAMLKSVNPRGHTLSKVILLSNYFNTYTFTYLTSKVHFPSTLLCSS